MIIPKTSLKSLQNVENMACSACYGSLIHALDRLGDLGYPYGYDGKIYRAGF